MSRLAPSSMKMTNHMSEPYRVLIHTDGACSGNPGPGGYGAILTNATKTLEISGGDPDTTSNRMELMAAIKALEALKRPTSVRLVSDSTYVVSGVTRWLAGWKARNWKNVKNVDLWQCLEAAMAGHEITWQWVRGHNGHELNERADRLAKAGLNRQTEERQTRRH